MKKQLLKSALIAVAAIGLATGSAWADKISGTIVMNGGLTLTGGTNFLDSTYVDFLADSGKVVAGDGDLTFPYGTDVTMTDFDFSSFSEVKPLWQITATPTTYFDLLTVVASYTLDSNNYNVLTLSGTGMVYVDGLEATEGTWSLTTQEPSAAGIFTWSSSTSAVPEPATMLLFGTGIAGLAGLSRRKGFK